MTTQSGTLVPEGSVVGNYGDEYVKTDADPGSELFEKVRGPGLNTGWREVDLRDYLDVRRNAVAAQDAKFIGAGTYDLRGGYVSLSQFPAANVKLKNGYVRRRIGGPGSGFEIFGFYPVDYDSLPFTRTVMQAGPASSERFQNAGDTWEGETYTISRQLSGSGQTSNTSVVTGRATQGENSWAVREELWSPNSASAQGYACLAACIDGGIQYALVKGASDPRLWKLYRRKFAERKELPLNPLRVEAGERNIYIDRSVFSLGFYVGLRVKLRGMVGTIGGMTVQASGVTDGSNDYVVNKVTNDYVRLVLLTPPAPATSSAVGGGSDVVVTVNPTMFEEVRFAGNVSFGQALVNFGGLSQQPNLCHSMEKDPRVNFNSRLYTTFSLEDSTMAICRFDSCAAAGAHGGVTVYANIDYIKPMSNFLVPHNEMSIRFAFDSSGSPRLLGWSRSDTTSVVPLFYDFKESAINSDPITSTYDGNNPFKASPAPIVIDYSGAEPWIFGCITGSRNPELPAGFGFVDVWMMAAKLHEAIGPSGTGAAAFRFYHIGKVLWNDITVTDNSETSAVGVPTITLMPGGVRMFVGASAAPQGADATSNGASFIYKIDTRKITGYTGACDVSPDDVQNSDRMEAVHYGLAVDFPPDNPLRFQTWVHDDFTGTYDKTDGSFRPRLSGHYSFEAQVRPKSDGNEVRIVLREVGTGVNYVHPYSQATSPILLRAKLPLGTEMTVRGKIPSVYLLANRKYQLRTEGGTILAGAADTWLKVERRS